MRIFKVIHYGSKDMNLSTMFGIEALVTEYFIFGLCAAFAYMGYTGGLGLLFFLCLPASIFCLISAIYSTYEYIKYKRGVIRSNNDKVEQSEKDWIQKPRKIF